MSTARTDVGTVEDLQASAIKAVGLDDFGVDDDNYLEALGVLLESYRLDADFTELGSKMSRFFLRNALVARLLQVRQPGCLTASGVHPLSRGRVRPAA